MTVVLVVVVKVVVAAVRRSGGTGAAVRRMKRSHTPKPKNTPAASAAKSLIRTPPHKLGEDPGAIRRFTDAGSDAATLGVRRALLAPALG